MVESLFFPPPQAGVRVTHVYRTPPEINMMLQLKAASSSFSFFFFNLRGLVSQAHDLRLLYATSLLTTNTSAAETPAASHL